MPHITNNTPGCNTNSKTRSRAYTITSYNVEEDWTRMEELFSQKGWKYIIAKEICPKTKRTHLQCYFYHNNDVRWTTLKRMNDTWHIEVAKKNELANFYYCKKDGEYKTNMDEDEIIDMMAGRRARHCRRKVESMSETERMDIVDWCKQNDNIFWK